MHQEALWDFYGKIARLESFPSLCLFIILKHALLPDQKVDRALVPKTNKTNSLSKSNFGSWELDFFILRYPCRHRASPSFKALFWASVYLSLFGCPSISNDVTLPLCLSQGFKFRPEIRLAYVPYHTADCHLKMVCLAIFVHFRLYWYFMWLGCIIFYRRRFICNSSGYQSKLP